MPDIERLAINQITTRGQWGLREAIENYAKHGVRAIGIFRDMLADCGLDEAVRLVEGNGMTVTSLCAAGMFGHAGDAASWQAALDDNRRAIADAAALGARCLVMIGGGLAPGSKDLPGARKRFRDGVGEVLPDARAAGVGLGLEPLHPMSIERGCISTLKEVNDICDEVGEGAGVVVDLYHSWWEPGLEDQIARAKGRIRAFHICDWLVPTKLTQNERGMMGDGVVDIPRLRAAVEAAGYDGYNEVEIFSNDWWKRDPQEVVGTCIEAHARFV